MGRSSLDASTRKGGERDVERNSVVVAGRWVQSMIKGLKFASVPVTDQDRALMFYTEKLGFRVLTDQPFDDHQRWIELGLPGQSVSIVLFTPAEHRDRIGTFQNLTFYAEDVVRSVEEMKRKGVEFVQDPQEADWGTAAVFRDPDGNMFVLSTK